MATSVIQNYTSRQNTQDRLKQQQPLVNARVQNTQSGTQLNQARTIKTQKETQYVGQKGRGGGKAKATYDPVSVQGILSKIQDPAQQAYWAEYYRSKGTLPISVVNPKGGGGSRADKIKQIQGGASSSYGSNSNEARRKSLGIEY